LLLACQRQSLHSVFWLEVTAMGQQKGTTPDCSWFTMAWKVGQASKFHLGLCISYCLEVPCLSPPPRKAFPLEFVRSLPPTFISMLQLYIHTYLLYSSGCCLVALDIAHSIFNYANICVRSCNLSMYCVCIMASFTICINLFNTYLLHLLTTSCVLVISVSEHHFHVCTVRETGLWLECVYGSIPFTTSPQSSPYHVMFLPKECKLKLSSHHDLIHAFVILINLIF
jgi:hypothetical protein